MMTNALVGALTNLRSGYGQVVGPPLLRFQTTEPTKMKFIKKPLGANMLGEKAMSRGGSCYQYTGIFEQTALALQTALDSSRRGPGNCIDNSVYNCQENADYGVLFGYFKA